MSIRVVPTADAPEAGQPVTMAEAIVALAARVAAENPTLVMIVYESPPGKVNVRSLPNSPYVAEILAVRAKEMLHPDADATE
jgi:hypothetical protein